MSGSGDSSGTIKAADPFEDLWRQLGECHHHVTGGKRLLVIGQGVTLINKEWIRKQVWIFFRKDNSSCIKTQEQIKQCSFFNFYLFY